MRKVLIIMDQDSLRNRLQQDLAQDFEVLTCTNATDGSKFLLDLPDVIILDLFLPGTDGLSFLKLNHDCLPPVVIALSALTSPDVLQELADLGIHAVIRTPCTPKAILSALMAYV